MRVGGGVMGQSSSRIQAEIRAEIHGDVLTALMRKHGISASMLARRTDVSAAYIRMLCNGQRGSTKTVTAQQIATALGEPVRSFASPTIGIRRRSA